MVRKANQSLKSWVSFVKKVQKEEGLGYSEAMKRAKVRKDGGEKWMIGGNNNDSVMNTRMSKKGGSDKLVGTPISSTEQPATNSAKMESSPPAKIGGKKSKKNYRSTKIKHRNHKGTRKY